MSSPFAGFQQLRSYQRYFRWQGYQATPVAEFGGLNLIADPQELGWGGAADLLNVEFDQRGRVRSRDGFSKFTSSAAATRYSFLIVATPSAAATRQLVAYRNGLFGTATAFGTPTTDYVYAASFGISGTFAGINASGAEVATQTVGANVYRWTGTTWSSPAGLNNYACQALCVQPKDNRLVMAGLIIPGNFHRVQFSDAGAAETVTASSFVDLYPGEEDTITASCSWRELVFVFKANSYYVFYGNSTDGTGNPIFNYRPVRTGVGSHIGACVAGPDAVYFFHGTGIYRTTGGPPERISQAIQPLFDGTGLASVFQDSVINTSASEGTPTWFPRLTVHNNRLYVSVATGASTTSNRTLVYDIATGTWTLWDIPAAGLCSGGVANFWPNELFFSYASGTNDIGKLLTGTTDAGAAITSRYRAGFSDLGSPANLRKVIRQWSLSGTGTANFGVAANDATAIPTSGGGAQSSVNLAAATPNYRTSQMGRNFSWRVSSTSPWTLNSLVADVG